MLYSWFTDRRRPKISCTTFIKVPHFTCSLFHFLHTGQSFLSLFLSCRRRSRSRAWSDWWPATARWAREAWGQEQWLLGARVVFGFEFWLFDPTRARGEVGLGMCLFSLRGAAARRLERSRQKSAPILNANILTVLTKPLNDWLAEYVLKWSKFKLALLHPIMVIIIYHPKIVQILTFALGAPISYYLGAGERSIKMRITQKWLRLCSKTFPFIISHLEEELRNQIRE